MINIPSIELNISIGYSILLILIICKYFEDVNITKIPDKIARSSTGVGTPDDVIQVFERFLKAGVNHFVIRFWGSNYFGSIDKFASKVIPYFKEQQK